MVQPLDSFDKEVDLNLFDLLQNLWKGLGLGNRVGLEK